MFIIHVLTFVLLSGIFYPTRYRDVTAKDIVNMQEQSNQIPSSPLTSLESFTNLAANENYDWENINNYDAFKKCE